MLHRLIRRHARTCLLAALLPYLAASMFVNFFHTDTVAELGVCADHSVISVEPAPARGQEPFQHPEGPCPACVWLKVGGTRVEPPIAIGPAFHRIDAAPVPAPIIVPLSPVRYRSFFRGPPSAISL